MSARPWPLAWVGISSAAYCVPELYAMLTENRPNNPRIAAEKVILVPKIITPPCMKLNNPVSKRNEMAKIFLPFLSCNSKITKHDGRMEHDVMVKTVNGSNPNPSTFLAIAS